MDRRGHALLNRAWRQRELRPDGVEARAASRSALDSGRLLCSDLADLRVRAAVAVADQRERGEQAQQRHPGSREEGRLKAFRQRGGIVR